MAEDVSFSRQLAPILARRCLGCHDNRKTEGRYALHTFEMLLKAGDSGEPPIVAGNVDDSYFWAKLTESDADLRMPQEDDPLRPDELKLFRQWIEQGAKFDGPNRSDRLVTLLPPRKHPLPPETYRVPLPIFAIKFSTDGKALLTGGWHELLVWDPDSGQLKQRIAGLPQRIHCMEYSPDGRLLAIGGGAPGEYGEIRLVNAANLSKNANPTQDHDVLTVWEDIVLDLKFAPDGRTLIAGGADNSVRAYDMKTHDEIWRTTQHAGWVTAVDVTGYRFAERLVPNEGLPGFIALDEHETKSGSHVQQHWQFPNDRFIVREANWELEATLENTSRGMLFTKSLTKITTTGIGKTYKVKREAIDERAFPRHLTTIIYLVGVHMEWPRELLGTEFVVSSSQDRTAKVFALSTGELFTTYKGHRREYGPLAGLHRVFGVQAEPGSRRVWSGGEGKHFHGWNPVTVRDEDGTAADMEARFAKEYSIDPIHHDFPSPVFALQRSGERLFAAAANGQVKKFALTGPDALFDAKRVATRHTYTGHADHLFALDVNSSAELVAAAGYSGEVVIWDVTTGAEMTRFVAAPGLAAD
jgi:WD40 repeat protein